MLVGHPAFCVRAPGAHLDAPSDGVTIETVSTTERLAVAASIAVDGYPMEELEGSPAGTLLRRRCSTPVCRAGSGSSTVNRSRSGCATPRTGW
jgi:hypothetical protein